MLGWLAVALALSQYAYADEGMWMPQQVPQISRQLKAAGLLLEPLRLARLDESPLGAIVSLGGCTGSFVSAKGLVATNHHCVYGSLQYNTSPTRDLLKAGFLARTTAEELPAAPGSRIWITVGVHNVTNRIVDARTRSLSGSARVTAMQTHEKVLVAACETELGHRCEVFSYYGGLQFWLVDQLEVRDVRLVYAPPDGVGRFGGERDNWMWPRHTGDFSFLRAYVGRDGKPADFSPDNVPYHPKVHLRLARTGTQEGDFVMVAGYPGRTNRQRLPVEVRFTFEWRYPELVKVSRERLEIMSRETRDRKAAEIAYASTVVGINNVYKKTVGLLSSYSSSSFLDRKEADLVQLEDWAQASPATRLRYDQPIDNLTRLLKERQRNTRREFLLPYASPRLLEAARVLYKLANEKAKPTDLDRDPEYQQHNWSDIRQQLESIDKRYDEQVDKALAFHFLKAYLALPAHELCSAFLDALGLSPGLKDDEIRTRLDNLYRNTRLGDKAQRLAWLDRDISEFRSSEDAFIRAAVSLYPDDLQREERDKDLQGALQGAYTEYMAALIAYRADRHELLYPDANETLRLTFGKVEGRRAGAVDGMQWAAFTTVRGIVAKSDGTEDFSAPPEQISEIQAGRFGNYAAPEYGSVPVDFLASLDITGGNSGSPVLNGRGELVGLAFDGTLDSVLADWDFNPATSRAIAVDLRYMLWQLRVVDKAHNLLSEMDAW